MKLRSIESIAEEEGIKYRKALRIFKRANVKVYGTWTSKKVDAEIAEEIFSEREIRRGKWMYHYEKDLNESFHV